jgi:YHS domain-containing protein
MPKLLSVFLFALCITLGVAGTAYLRAEDKAPTTKPAVTAAVNTKCPVSGEDIDPSLTIVYKGKTIAFCCADCETKFNKDPDAYVAKMK